jgi:hypothetical protein
MPKEKSEKIAAAQGAEGLSGHVSGLRVTTRWVEFDLEDKKKRTHTFALEASAAALVSLASAAYISGKKLHVTAKAANGSGQASVTELRFGNKPKVEKAKQEKQEKLPVKSPAEAAAAPAEAKAPSA